MLPFGEMYAAGDVYDSASPLRQHRIDPPAGSAYHAAGTPLFLRVTRPRTKDTTNMKSMHKTQQGLSGIGLIILLVIIGACTYIGLQYIPQYMEAGTVDSILSSLEKAQEETPFNSTNAVRDMINKQLTVNQMEDLRDSFKVTQDGEAYIVEVSFMRELNLIFTKQPMPYEQILTLR